MTTDTPSISSKILSSFFRFIVKRRYWVAAFYLALCIPCAYFAITRITYDNSLERLIVQTDEDYKNTKKHEAVFGKGEFVVIMLQEPKVSATTINQACMGAWSEPKALLKPNPTFAECPAVWQPSMVQLSAGIHATLVAEGFQTNDLFSLLSKTAATDITRLPSFIQQAPTLMKQGLLSPNSWIFQIMIPAQTALQRTADLKKLDKLLEPFKNQLPASIKLVKIGEPYVNSYLDETTRSAGMRYFPLFALFVVILNWFLYRSLRALFAFILPLLTSVIITVGYIGMTGGQFTIVSSLVPMTILIVCTSTLVYLHSRFVECPPDRDPKEHQIFALENKFLACTASIFAAGVGFAALAISDIRPIREMGIWVALGLLFTWVMVFTLFPALQSIFNTPTQQQRAVAGKWFLRLVDWLPKFTYRFRYLLVGFAVLWCIGGAIALFGIPKTSFKPMKLETNAVEYINHSTDLYKETKAIENAGQGLTTANVWIFAKENAPKNLTVLNPQVLAGLKIVQDKLAQDANITSVVGLTNALELYAKFSPETLASLSKNPQNLSPQVGMLVDLKTFQQTNIVLRLKELDVPKLTALKTALLSAFKEAQAQVPALKEFDTQIVGLGPLQAKISHNLIPTLTDSLALSIVIIFAAFLLVFRSGAARIMALIPSLFAILAMFSIMRLLGLGLNVATILIASTVLGASENDQIHFFYHYQEKRKTASTEQSLVHTLLISGKAIFFATLINAAGFLAFGIADLPPIRQFGFLSALAFVLSMIADFTALPAALWLVFRDKPDSLKK